MEKIELREHILRMQAALVQAKIAEEKGEVPIGAVMVEVNSGEMVAHAFNRRRLPPFDPCGHAEILAMRESCEKVVHDWRLNSYLLYVTLEPCPMCLAAMVQARVGGLIFGAYDKKGGALSLGYALHRDSRLNHRFPVLGGIYELECAGVLRDFFKKRRSMDSFHMEILRS
ncbi:MAG: nucleoside deaminase [Oligoflexia bacterium]|nr:nucleoside deaminase [Oligoflexia bacterium]MBF0365560.1 nucleoside deaminase [Oligoflexia bacterium]